MVVSFCKQGFLTSTMERITVAGAEGWRAITILCASDSAADIVVTSDIAGTATIGGKPCGQITLKAGNSITVGVGENVDVDGVIIDTTGGGTAYIAGSRFLTQSY